MYLPSSINVILFKNKTREFFTPFTSKQVRETFRRYDLNKNGVVSMNELRTVMEKVGMNLTQKQMDDMLATAGGLIIILKSVYQIYKTN